MAESKESKQKRCNAAKSADVVGGVGAGAAGGAAAGSVIAGPVGALIGGALGAGFGGLWGYFRGQAEEACAEEEKGPSQNPS